MANRSPCFSLPFPPPTAESLLGMNYVRPKWRSPYDAIDSVVTKNRSVSPPARVSVENFDPRSQDRIFNESFTLQALANLRVRERDLYHPVAEDLAPITGDKQMYREHLIKRSLQLADAVRIERSRILRESAGLESEGQRGRVRIITEGVVQPLRRMGKGAVLGERGRTAGDHRDEVEGMKIRGVRSETRRQMLAATTFPEGG
jgi:hypothetical protein